MQDHAFSFEVSATREEIWALFWGHRTRVLEHGDVRIEYLHWGDESGEGRIRHCHFRVPRYLLSGGVGRSWEWLTEVKPCESWRYDAIGKPLFSRATGWTRLEDLDEIRDRARRPGDAGAAPARDAVTSGTLRLRKNRHAVGGTGR